MACESNNFSQRGMGINLPTGMEITHGQQLKVSLSCGNETCQLPAKVVFSKGTTVGLSFIDLNLRQQFELTRMTFSRADTWASTWGQGVVDAPLTALAEVSVIGWRGIRQLTRATRDELARRIRSTSDLASTNPRNS